MAGNGQDVSQSGNRYVFANQPTLTVTTTDASKPYGDSADLSSHFTVSGFHPGVANAFQADTDTSLSGAPDVTSRGNAPGTSAAGSPYTIDARLGTLASPSGYAFAFNNAGLLTFTPRTLAATAALASSVLRDQLLPILLPDNAAPVFGAPVVSTTLGTGVFYVDPRFERIFVCFGSGAQVCFAAKTT